MKTTLIMTAILLVASLSQAGERNYGFGGSSGSRPYEDAWGNNYKKQSNMWKDSDGDGVVNYYDSNDRNPRIQNPYQSDYQQPRYQKPSNNYNYGSGNNSSRRRW